VGAARHPDREETDLLLALPPRRRGRHHAVSQTACILSEFPMYFSWEKAVPLYSKVANSVRLYLNTVGLFLPVRKYQWIPYCATD